MPQIISFIVAGLDQATREAVTDSPSDTLTKGRLKHFVRLGSEREGRGETRIDAVAGEDVLELQIENGPVLVLHPENARDLFLAQTSIKRRGEEQEPDTIRVPAQLAWRGLEGSIVQPRGGTRGFFGKVVLSAIKVVAGISKESVADFAASEVVKRIDGQVDNGVYVLRPDSLPQLKGSKSKVREIEPSSDGQPILVLVHGSFSNTNGTFGKLWSEHPALVHAVFKQYDKRVYALEHPTLGVSPIGNALTLVRALPKNARLHLLTHSRGGLVAEVLARVAAAPKLAGEELQAFASPAYKEQREELKALADLIEEKAITVERIVRVACPARGTLLASRRLDAYLSVFRWTLQLAGIPVAPEIVDFLTEVAKRRAEPEMLPGLAAQIPDSPLVQWLHASDEAIPGQLRVVAGDVEGDSVRSWLKTLLADAYYWTDNDLIVQTRSMYGGTPRTDGASFLFDQGVKVSHFQYFSNEKTATALVDALLHDEPPNFRTIGPLSWSGKSASGDRAAARGEILRAGGQKPALFVLPGILGSNLKVNGKRIWLGWRIINGLGRLKYDPRQPDSIEPDGMIESTYEDLVDYLKESHHVIEFPYDWRLPIEEEARRLGAAVETALAVREESGQPVRLLAHSMGGLVARTMQLEMPHVWERMMARSGARLLMLGTPNGGSWAPMQVLSGDDTFGNTLVAFGAPFHDRQARDMMARFPGFIQLQAALLDPVLGLDKNQTWQALATEDLNRVREFNWWHKDDRQLTPYMWGVPPQDVLDHAVTLRNRLDAQLAQLGAHKDKIRLVVGKARFTPDGYEIGTDGLVYLDAQGNGDGRVTLRNALLPGVRTWALDCEHGKLPDLKSAFKGYRELLDRGDTNEFESLGRTGFSRGAALRSQPITYLRSRPSRGMLGMPPQTPAQAFATASEERAAQASGPGTCLRVTVVNGNLKFIRQPLMLGHYRAGVLTGSQRVMDELIGGTMTKSLNMGQYPDSPGTHQVFINAAPNRTNPFQLPRPEAVIVIGLGEEGKLRASDLVKTVRQGTIAWALRSAELATKTPKALDLAATLIGSGGTGISAGQAGRMVAMGVREANELLAREGWPCIGHLHLVELYLDRATEAWRALNTLAGAEPGSYVIEPAIQSGVGPLRRPLDSNYRGADHDFITAASSPNERGESLITYVLDSKRARNEVRAQATQGSLVRDMIGSASNMQDGGTQIGRTLFQLLIPIEMEAILQGATATVLELDSGTAGIPWEMLDTPNDGRVAQQQPWAIRSKLLRKLRTGSFRADVKDAGREAHVLIIGEPKSNPALYPALPGARDEANAVTGKFRQSGVLSEHATKALIRSESPGDEGPDALTIIDALLNRPWRIIHIAGHGMPPEKIGPAPKDPGDPPQKDGQARGVVLSNGAYLGPNEIRNMREVPELVFVNCCHLAASDTSQLLQPPEQHRYDRPHFAANVAEALIGIGVRCVIAAGWAVDDHAAKVFATIFYDALLSGARFIDAVARARQAAWQCGGTTWAAYQCYGDPDWVFQPGHGEARPSSVPLADVYAGVASGPALTLALEALIVASEFDDCEHDALIEKLSYLEAHFAARWGAIGAVAESFGRAWHAAGDMERGIAWYEKAVAANDGSASIKACEQLGNLRAHRAWESIERLASSRTSNGKDGSAASSGNGQDPHSAALIKAQSELEGAIAMLQQLAELQPTIERESLCGGAYRRLAMAHAQAKQRKKEADALQEMKKHFGKAEQLARESGSAEFFYPALNRIAVELVTDGADKSWKGLDADMLAAIRRNLKQRHAEDPDFWSAMGLIKMRLFEAIADKTLASALPQIQGECADLYKRVAARNKWKSARDQLNFVLFKYLKRTSGPEQEAVTLLLSHIDEWAGDSRTPNGCATPQISDVVDDAANGQNAPSKARLSKTRPQGHDQGLSGAAAS